MSKTCEADIQQAVNKIYCAMLDNTALAARQAFTDTITYGTGAVFTMSTIDSRTRHCATHGCPHCKRRIKTEVRRAQARTALVLGVLALMALVFYLLGRS